MKPRLITLALKCFLVPTLSTAYSGQRKFARRMPFVLDLTGFRRETLDRESRDRIGRS